MDVTAQKVNIQTEEIVAGSAVSEGTAQRMAASINFWNKNYEGSRSWVLNGRYDIFSGVDVGVDGAFAAPVRLEVYAVMMYCLEAGTANVTEFDLIVNKADGSPSTSLFATRPRLAFSSGNNSWLVQNLKTNTTIYASAGAQIPVANSIILEAGDLVTCNLTMKQTGGKSCGIVIYVQPIS